MGKRKIFSLDDLVAKLEDKPVKYLRTGLVPLDLVFGGRGIGLGAMYQYYAGSGFGKTTSMFSAAKTMADQGLKSLIMLSERSDQLAEDMGLKREPYADLVKLAPFSTYRELEQWSHSFMASDYKTLWIDSITACVPSKLINDDISVEDSTPGLNAGIRQNYLRVFQSLVHDTDKAIFYINQTRANWDAGWNGEAEVAEGVYANKFFADCQFTMRGAKSIPDLLYDKKIIARQGHMLAPTKNRFALHGVKVPIQVIFGKGISNFYTLTHYLYWKGAVKVRGSWFDIAFKGETASVQGRVGRSQWVKDNYPALMESFYQDAPEYFEALSNGFDVMV